jgi:DNA (cytosine-5)-methyltransferase 1
MNQVRHVDLFSGIGGFALAAQTVWGGEYNVELFCDTDEYCQAVLRKHWPATPIYANVLDLTANRHWRRSSPNAGEPSERQRGASQSIDLLTGGFPCQPFSVAGRRRGANDDRFLWPQMHRVIREFHPRWVIAENVRGLLSQERGLVFEQVCADLERLAYEVQAFVIPALRRRRSPPQR